MYIDLRPTLIKTKPNAKNSAGPTSASAYSASDLERARLAYKGAAADSGQHFC